MLPETQTPQTPPGPDKYKILFFLLLFIVTVSLTGGVFYFLGKQQTVKPEPVPAPSVTPAITTVFPPYDADPSPLPDNQEVKDEEIIPAGQNTVSFARDGENTYLRYRGKIHNDSDQLEPQTVQIPNPDQHSWYGLVDAPDGVTPNEFMEDEVFSYRVAPDKKSFAFVMRWAIPPPPKYPAYYLFYYTPFDKYRQSMLVKTFSTSDKGVMSVAKINQFDNESKYLTLNMYGCWNCGGHQPETLLVRLKDNETKNIGRTSYFNWLTGGKYEYKDYVVITCTEETMGECFEKPESLPLKTGQF